MGRGFVVMVGMIKMRSGGITRAVDLPLPRLPTSFIFKHKVTTQCKHMGMIFHARYFFNFSDLLAEFPTVHSPSRSLRAGPMTVLPFIDHFAHTRAHTRTHRGTDTLLLCSEISTTAT